jgi:hypothetical protein
MDLVRTNVLEEDSTSIIRVKGTSELRTLAVTSNRRTLWFLQESHDITSQKMAFFRPLGRSRHRWMDNIIMDLIEIGWGGVD